MSRPSDPDNPDYETVAAAFSIREPIYCDGCFTTMNLLNKLGVDEPY